MLGKCLVLVVLAGFLYVVQPSKTDTVLYTVTVTTGKDFGAGTDSEVYIRIYGPKGNITKELNTDKNDFENGSTDKFKFVAKNVGNPIQKVELYRTSSLLGPWKVKEVSVKGSAPLFFKFGFNEWLPADKWTESYGGKK